MMIHLKTKNNPKEIAFKVGEKVRRAYKRKKLKITLHLIEEVIYIMEG